MVCATIGVIAVILMAMAAPGPDQAPMPVTPSVAAWQDAVQQAEQGGPATTNVAPAGTDSTPNTKANRAPKSEDAALIKTCRG